MESRIAKTLLQLARPQVGQEIGKLIRELLRLAGVRGVAPIAKIPRLLSIKFDPKLIQGETLVRFVRRGWAGARLV